MVDEAKPSAQSPNPCESARAAAAVQGSAPPKPSAPESIPLSPPARDSLISEASPAAPAGKHDSGLNAVRLGNAEADAAELSTFTPAQRHAAWNR